MSWATFWFLDEPVTVARSSQPHETTIMERIGSLMTDEPISGTDRRTFMKQAAGTMLAAGMSAKSYARVLGANDRIRIGQLGCGDRSEGHVHMVSLAAKQMPVEVVAVCDIWSMAREHRAAQVKRAFKNEPHSFKYSEQMLELKDLDG